MIDDPNALPPVSDDELRSTIRRRNDLMQLQHIQENKGLVKTKQSDIEYKSMVKALLGGKATWENWQDKNSSVPFYDFQYLDFIRQINLNGATFNKEVFFTETVFKYGAIFFEVKFNNYANFQDAEFNNGIHFAHAKFAKGANFNHAKFKSVTHFAHATFKKEAIFSNVKFIKWINFQQITFSEYANFQHAKFMKNARFQHTKFIKEVDFRKAKFCKDADFGQVTFDKNASFDNVKFGEAVNFNRTTFADEANFGQATFTERAYFQLAKFKDGANFKQAVFAERVVFNQARFQSSGFFNEAEFRGNEINFSEMILSADSNLIFTGARFENAVPDFRHLNRSPDIRFHNLSVLSPDEWNLDNEWDDDNEDRYRKLKELAIGNNNHEYELIFYGHEMNSKLISFDEDKNERIFNKRWWIDILPTRFYKCFSNYGQSMWRPLIWLAVLAFIYILDWKPIFKIILSLLPFINNFNWGALVDIVKTILPLPLFTFIDNVDGDGKVIGIRLISDGKLTAKMIATFFWFLFFLAMRNKFKIK